MSTESTKIESGGPELRSLAIASLVLSWFGVMLRCYVRLFLVKVFAIDDWLMLLTLMVFTTSMVFLLICVHLGVGRHLLDLDFKNLSPLMKYVYFYEWTYCASSMLVKFAFGAFYLRIVNAKWQKIVIWSAMAVAGVVGFGFTCLFIFQCSPVTYTWKQFAFDGSTGKCISRSTVVKWAYVQGAVGIAADLTLGLLPIFLVKTLNMGIKTKISVAGLLSLGFVVSISTIVRMFYIDQFQNPDFFYSVTKIGIWSSLEPALGLLVSGLAVSRPLFKVAFNGYSTVRSKVTGRRRARNALPDEEEPASQRARSNGVKSTPTHCSDIETAELKSFPHVEEVWTSETKSRNGTSHDDCSDRSLR